MINDIVSASGRTSTLLFSDIRRIEDALARHSCTEALAWCSENKAALRKMKVGQPAYCPSVPLDMQHYRALSSSTSASKNTSNFPERQNAKKPSSTRANTWSRGRKPTWTRSSKRLPCSLSDPTHPLDDTRCIFILCNALPCSTGRVFSDYTTCPDGPRLFNPSAAQSTLSTPSRRNRSCT